MPAATSSTTGDVAMTPAAPAIAATRSSVPESSGSRCADATRATSASTNAASPASPSATIATTDRSASAARELLGGRRRGGLHDDRALVARPGIDRAEEFEPGGEELRREHPWREQGRVRGLGDAGSAAGRRPARRGAVGEQRDGVRVCARIPQRGRALDREPDGNADGMPCEPGRRTRSRQQKTHVLGGKVTDVDGHHDETERGRQLSRSCAGEGVERLEGLSGVGRERPLCAERRERPHRQIGAPPGELRDDDTHAELRAERVRVERAPHADRTGAGRAHDEAPLGTSGIGNSGRGAASAASSTRAATSSTCHDVA